MPYKPLSKTVDRIRKGDVLQATHSKRGWEALFVVDRITRAGIVHATLCRYQRETAPPNGLSPRKVRFTREGDRLVEVISRDDFMALGRWIEDVRAEKLSYLYTPETCPSTHWNDGSDICADCGKDLHT